MSCTFSFPAECAATARQLEQFKNTRAAKTSSNDNSTDLTEGRGYFTQLTLNEYIPGQGISSHIGRFVVSPLLSLSLSCNGCRV